MPDSTLATIDRFFDLVDSGVAHVDRVLNRGRETAEKQRSRKAGRSEIIDTEVTAKSSREASAPATVPTSATTSLARKARFYIVESITPAGDTNFVVTDGGNARTVCASRVFAEQILQALEKAS